VSELYNNIYNEVYADDKHRDAILILAREPETRGSKPPETRETTASSRPATDATA
jgi:hypothetical protein